VIVGLIVLASIGFIAALAGGVWLVLREGRIRTSTGREAGAKVFSDPGDAGAEGAGATLPVAEAFRGTGIMVEGEAETSYARIRGQLRSGDWTAAAPSLLGISGLITAMISIALILGIVVEPPLLGWGIAALMLFTLVRALNQFRKA
jgi:hypothetical protein